jgi:hypothetical protein
MKTIGDIDRTGQPEKMRRLSGLCRRQIPCLATALLVTVASGCATPTLWQRTSAFEWRPELVYKVMLPANTNQPSAPLVVFSQTADVHSPFVFTRKVGWQVGHPFDDVADTREAIRQLTEKASGFQSIPVYFPGRVSTNVLFRPPRYAVVDFRSCSHLTLYINGVPAGPYTLPTNHHSKKTAERLLLTPFAVVLDVPICAFGLAVFIGVLASH